MRKEYVPFDYQEEMIEHLRVTPEAALFCSPGLGKSVCTLKAWEWLSINGDSRGMLIIAPIRVCNITWPNEVAKWDFCDWMTIANLRTPEGIEHWENGTADIYVINSEQLATRKIMRLCPFCQNGERYQLVTSAGEVRKEFRALTRDRAKDAAHACVKGWKDKGYDLKHFAREDCEDCWGDGELREEYPGFVERYIKGRKVGDLPVDTLVVDELSLVKSSKSKRFNSIRAHRDHFERCWGLTGTPAPNSLLDLWSPLRFLDSGKRLGVVEKHYEKTHFWLQSTGGYPKLKIRPGHKEIIEEKISDIVLTMLGDDYLDVPACIHTDVPVTIPAKVRRIYDEIEDELIYEFSEGTLEVKNMAVLTQKLMQLTGGAVYTGEKGVDQVVIDVHDVKIKALKKLVKKHQGEPLLVLTQFIHERKRILEAIPEARLFKEKDMAAWQAKEIPIWVTDPRSISHGIDGMQKGGRIAIWYTQTYSNETVIQTNARLVRTGQSCETLVYRLIVEDSIDEAVAEAIREKGEEQDGLLQALVNLQRLRGVLG